MQEPIPEGVPGPERRHLGGGAIAATVAQVAVFTVASLASIIIARALGPAVQFTSMGSSLKFCLVAEGKADLYLRDLPTMEWDTAAAQCVLEHAGGAVFDATPSDLDTGTYTPLRYNKDTLRNPPFLAAGDPRGGWRERLGSGSGGRGGAMTKRAR